MDHTENISPIIAPSLIAGVTTCPQNCSLSTAVVLPPVYTAVTWQWVYMSQYLSKIHFSIISFEQFDVEVTLCSCVREVPGSNLGLDTRYPDWRVSWFFPLLPGKCQYSTSIGSQPLPFKSFRVYYSSVILPVDATQCGCLQHPELTHKLNHFPVVSSRTLRNNEVSFVILPKFVKFMKIALTLEWRAVSALLQSHSLRPDAITP
jgi:hypothetical protein